MIPIVCVDDHNGVSFNHRRQSMDRALRAHILALVGEERLWMNEYTARQFSDAPAERLAVAEDFLAKAGEEDYCFVEGEPLAPWAERFAELVVVRWNRTYPADQWLDVALDAPPWERISAEEFPGHSHEKLTKEVYRR